MNDQNTAEFQARRRQFLRLMAGVLGAAASPALLACGRLLDRTGGA